MTSLAIARGNALSAELQILDAITSASVLVLFDAIVANFFVAFCTPPSGSSSRCIVLQPSAMPVVRSRAPQYPRPVSPVCAEEIPVCSDTVVYYDHENGDEGNAARRAAKRKRIEGHATSYLRGQPLFILSAQLRGPFDDGWQNPWVKKNASNVDNSESFKEMSEQHSKPTVAGKQTTLKATMEHAARTTTDAGIHLAKERRLNPQIMPRAR